MSNPIKGVVISGSILLAWTGIGVLGFIFIEGWSVLDSLYMTVITISTVGFGVVKELSSAGKAFAIVLIIGGWISSFNALAWISQLLFEGGFFDILGEKKRRNRIMELENHYIVCGYGRMGKGIVDGLKEKGEPFVVLDNDPGKADLFAAEGFVYVIGDSTSEDVLREAGIERARVLLALLPSDADNLYLSIAAKEVNPQIYLISRALYDVAEKRLKKGGADMVISPYKIASHHALHAAVSLSPGMSLEIGKSEYGVPVSVREVLIDEGSELVAKSIIDSKLKSQFGVLVVGIKKKEGDVTINPEPTAVFNAGDMIVVAGENSNISKVQALCAG